MCTWSCVGLRLGALDALRRNMLYHYRCTFRTATQHAVRLSFWCRLQRACCTSAYSTRSQCRPSTSARSRTAYCPLVQMTRRLASLSRHVWELSPGWRRRCPLSLAGPVPTVRQVCDARAIAEPTVLIGNYVHDSLPCDALWIGSCAPPYCKRSTTRCNAAHTTVQRSTHQVQRSAHHGATQYNTVQQQAARVRMAACVLAG